MRPCRVTRLTGNEVMGHMRLLFGGDNWSLLGQGLEAGWRFGSWCGPWLLDTPGFTREIPRQDRVQSTEYKVSIGIHTHTQQTVSPDSLNHMAASGRCQKMLEVECRTLSGCTMRRTDDRNQSTGARRRPTRSTSLLLDLLARVVCAGGKGFTARRLDRRTSTTAGWWLTLIFFLLSRDRGESWFCGATWVLHEWQVGGQRRRPRCWLGVWHRCIYSVR